MISMDVCQGENTSLKRKKTRRGRKKRCRCRCRFTFEDQPGCSCGRFDIDSETDCQVDFQKPKHRVKSHRNMLRPSSSPKAPRNTTEFLMDDHLASRQPNFYNLDNSFKEVKCSPASPALRLSEEDNIYDNLGLGAENEEQCVPGISSVPLASRRKSKMSPAFSDIDYQYESFEVEYDETFNFQQQDFETAYSSILEETLQSESKSDLIDKVVFMEQKLLTLEKKQLKLEDTKTSVDIDKLMCELQELQAENRTLKEENRSLKSSL